MSEQSLDQSVGVAPADGAGTEFREAGRRAAGHVKPQPATHASQNALKKRIRAIRRAIAANDISGTGNDQRYPWIRENRRLLATAEKETRDLAPAARELPADAATGEPRVCRVAAAYLEAAGFELAEPSLTAFLAGFEEVQQLLMGELWALRPALELLLLEKARESAAANSAMLPRAVSSIRSVAEADWKVLFESSSAVHAILCNDPAGAYSAMEYESREQYRSVVAGLAERSHHTETEVAQAAVDHAAAHSGRRRHIGYYLIGKGLPAFKQHLGFRPAPSSRLIDAIVRNGTLFYLSGVELLTFLIAFALLAGLDNLTPVFAGFFLLLLPATQAAVDFMNNLTSFLLRPRALPKLDFADGIPADCATMVAVPALLLNEPQVEELVADLEIRYLANRDPNIYFALLTDSPDADQQTDERDRLAEVCHDRIQQLNVRYARPGAPTPFYLFHRHRVYNPVEGRWMGWERKRGKLLDLNRRLRGGFNSFPIACGDESVLPSIRYVIALDADTQLPRDAARRMIGAIAHPLNRAVIDPNTRMVVEGYGILQPRIGVSIQSASRSWLAAIYSGQTGFDIYTRAISDAYQDLFGEGIYTGKGIYDVDALRESLEHRFPDNALLSHDLIEGAFSRAGLATDIELIDDYPSHFSAYNRRKHRWLRGDWQILKWLLPRAPNRDNTLAPNPISLISRWKILDNLRRSLFEPATLLLLLSGWFYLPGEPAFWTAASVAMLLMPAYAGLLFSILRAPFGRSAFRAWLNDTIEAFGRDHLIVLLHLTFLLHDALLALDAIGRSLARVFVTRRKLLEWETAAEAEASKGRRAAVDRYLDWSPWLAVLIGAAVWFIRPPAFYVASPLLLAWLLAPLVSRWLGTPPAEESTELSPADRAWLRLHALRTWRFFREFSSPETNWLIPDNVREDGTLTAMLSPTNLAFALNARIAAVHFGYLTVPEFAEQTLRTLESAARLARHRGHFLNWYDGKTGAQLAPLFVSTVDSGNLCAALWALKHAARQFRVSPPGEDVLWAGLRDVAELAGVPLERPEFWAPGLARLGEQLRADPPHRTGEAAWWVRELEARARAAQRTLDAASLLTEIEELAGQLAAGMEFGFLYQRRKKVLSVGYDTSTGTLEKSTYDLLASESRIATFAGIAKGDLPQESWFHLGRRHTLAQHERVLVSWTGTMFEYLMPALWMRSYPQTVLFDSMRAVVRVQQRYARANHIPWGISESGCVGDCPPQYGYAAFGVPELGMKLTRPSTLVVAPYATFLALMIDPQAAIANLRRMEQSGFAGAYGFYEAVEFAGPEPAVIRSWMAHHQGMSLLSVCNVLFDSPLQRYFHSEPQVIATERLLHERLPTNLVIDAERMPVLDAKAESAVTA